MEKEKQQDDSLNFKWQNAFQNLTIQDNPLLNALFYGRQNSILKNFTYEKLSSKQQPSSKRQKQESSSLFKQQMTNRQTQIKKCAINQQEQDSKQSQEQDFIQQGYKISYQPKSQKQRYYSKVYRERKKQRYKTLQEQNAYLKKKICDLEGKLIQQQIQLSKFKFSYPNKQPSVEDLSKQWVQSAQTMFQSFKVNPDDFNKQQYPVDSIFHKLLTDFYAQLGFAGRKKFQILNYHFNEILQNILKDSEKYLSLVFSKSQNYNEPKLLQDFQLINKTITEVLKSDGDLWNRLKLFGKFLHPMSLQLNKLISQFYRKYEDILCFCKKMHKLLLQTYLKNMEVGRKRVELEKFFDQYKYGKIMRNLRQKWFGWIRSMAQNEQQDKRKTKKGHKKKKIDNEFNI